MAEAVEYYIAAIADSIHHLKDEGTRFDGTCTLPLDRVLSFYSSEEIFGEVDQYLADPDLLTSALAEMQSVGLIKVWADDFADTLVHIHDPNALQEALSGNEPLQRRHLLNTNGYSWLVAALKRVNARFKITETDDDPEGSISSVEEENKWEPLKIDVEQHSVAEILAQIEGAVNGIAGDNGFAVEFSGERDNLVNHAQTTVESAKAGLVTVAQVKQHFVAAGRWLSDKFGGTIIGTLGSELTKWGLRLLGVLP